VSQILNKPTLAVMNLTGSANNDFLVKSGTEWVNKTPAQVSSLLAPYTTGNIAVATDADKTVSATDGVIILPEPTAVRTLTLPDASTMANKTIKIVCRSSTTGRWMLSGSFVQKGTLGSSLAVNFSNSGLVSGQTYILVSDGTKWYDIND
jgi:hypothetical protein